MSVTAVEDAEASRLRAAAEAGDADAGVAYARILLGRTPSDVDGAMPFLEPAARAGDAFAARTLAITLRGRGQHAAAARWYEAAARTDGGCAFGLATLLEAAGDQDGAARWYAHGAALGSLECRTNGAMLAARRGRRDEALPALREAAEAGDRVAADVLDRSESLRTHLVNLAEDIAAAEEDDEVQDLLEAVRDAQEHPGVYDLFPDLLTMTADVFDKAADVLGSADPLISKAFLLDDLGHWDDARRCLERAADRFPEQPRLAHVLGLMFREHGEPADADVWLRRAADAGHADAQWSLAVLSLKLRRLDEAERWYRAYGEQAEALAEPRDFAAGLELAAAARRAGADPAERGATRLTALRSAAAAGDADAGLALGDVLLDCGALPATVLPLLVPAAERAYDRAQANANEEDVALVERVGGLYLRAKDDANAERWLRRAARLGHGRAAWWAGNRSDETGDGQEAERLWAAAATGGVPFCGWLAGRAMVRRGAHADAEPLLRLAYDAREAEPPLHEAAYWLGLSRRGQGDLEQAATWLRTAVEVHPTVRRGYTGFRLASLFDPREQLAEVLLDLDRDGEAARLVDGILADHPRHRTARALAGRLAERGAARPQRPPGPPGDGAP